MVQKIKIVDSGIFIIILIMFFLVGGLMNLSGEIRQVAEELRNCNQIHYDN